MPRGETGHRMTRQTMIDLYFKIESHFAHGGGALSQRDVKKMLGCASSHTAMLYVKRIGEIGLIQYSPRTVRTVILHPEHVKHYPKVIYADMLAKQIAEVHQHSESE